MEVVVLHVEGCPNVELAESRLKLAAERLDLDVQMRREQVKSLTQAEKLGFGGSPTLLVNGVDLLPQHPGAPGLACRLYRTRRGVEGAPSLADLEEAISSLG